MGEWFETQAAENQFDVDIRARSSSADPWHLPQL